MLLALGCSAPAAGGTAITSAPPSASAATPSSPPPSPPPAPSPAAATDAGPPEAAPSAIASAPPAPFSCPKRRHRRASSSGVRCPSTKLPAGVVFHRHISTGWRGSYLVEATEDGLLTLKRPRPIQVREGDPPPRPIAVIDVGVERMRVLQEEIAKSGIGKTPAGCWNFPSRVFERDGLGGSVMIAHGGKTYMYLGEWDGVPDQVDCADHAITRLEAETRIWETVGIHPSPAPPPGNP